MAKRALVWLRRDLRLTDHAPLAAACEEADEVALCFVFDRNILDKIKNPSDRRISFIYESLEELNQELRSRGSRILLLEGDPIEEIPKLAKKLHANLVLAGTDFEPYAKARDSKVARALEQSGIELRLLKDQVIFSGREVETGSKTAFRVFTPYKREWLKRLRPEHFDSRDPNLKKLLKEAALKSFSQNLDLGDIGFQKTDIWLLPGQASAKKALQSFVKTDMAGYQEARNFPELEATSHLSVHLRFGTLSIRACVREALKQKSLGAETWLSELIWRDFFQMILDQFPHVAKGAFRPEYDKIDWPGGNAHFSAWKEGRTGFPLIDAAMKKFARTGWMHNRLRMVTASFLVKDLLVSWQKGEEYFAENLLDFDLAANNGGWQWCASTGCDAQPYFRIFNPLSQSEKFDPQGRFIRSEIPELASLKGKEIHSPPLEKLGSLGYPKPIVDHSAQRIKALALYKGVK